MLFLSMLGPFKANNKLQTREMFALDYDGNLMVVWVVKSCFWPQNSKKKTENVWR
jgi:hypothetical protein